MYLNDEDVRVLDGLDTAVGDSDTLVILPAMAGGQAPDRFPAPGSPQHHGKVLGPSGVYMGVS